MAPLRGRSLLPKNNATDVDDKAGSGMDSRVIPSYFPRWSAPPLSPQHWPMLPLMTAVAVQEALELLGIGSARIKWPNDLLVNGKKISGILCELSSEGTDLSYAVLGVGLNVNTPLEDMPDEIHEIACSMTSVCGHRFELKEVLDLILNRLDHWLERSVTDDFDSVREQWKERNCTLGQFVTLDNGPSHLSGEAIGIADSGALMLKDEQGRVHTVFSGDLHFAPDIHSM